MKAKLTVRSVEGVKPGIRDVIIWDTELAGFGCKVTPKGRRSYFLYYRTKEGQQRRPSIGVHGPVRPDAAREIARRWLADVAQGIDPSQVRAEAKVAPTVSDLCVRYLSEHAVRKKPSYLRNNQRLINNRVLPVLGKKKVADVSREDVAAMHSDLSETPYEANRTLALCSKMFSLAERWKLIAPGTNPAKNIDRFKETKRERYLKGPEIARLWAVLNSDDVSATVAHSAIAAIKLLMLTGRRLSEVLNMQWSSIDFKARTLYLSETKTGPLLVSLGDGALEILAELKVSSKDDIFVISGRHSGKPLVNLQKPWRKIRTQAGLDDVRIHDLRHTFGSIGAGLGMSLPLLGRLLGHTQVATTSRYAHLSQDPVRDAADAIGAEFLRMALGEDSKL